MVQVSDQNLNTIWFPRENDGGWVTDGSILFTNCMGFDPEEFDPESPKTKEWVDRFSYPVETAEEIVKQINAEAKGWKALTTAVDVLNGDTQEGDQA